MLDTTVIMHFRKKVIYQTIVLTFSNELTKNVFNCKMDFVARNKYAVDKSNVALKKVCSPQKIVRSTEKCAVDKTYAVIKMPPVKWLLF